MSKNFLLVVCGLFLFSCSDNMENLIERDSFISQETNVKQSSYFDEIVKPEVWKQYQSLEEMIDACQLPQQMLDTISTKDLIQLCYNYPLHSVYMAYNNQEKGLESTIGQFNGFKELRKRADAAVEIIDFYDKLYLPVYQTQLTNSNVDIIKFEYLEALLASDLIPEVYIGQYSTKLENAVQHKLRLKMSMPEIYGRKSLNISAQILNRKLMKVGESSQTRTGNLMSDEMNADVFDLGSYITVYTIYGTPVEGLIRSELSSSEISAADTYYQNTFPNAVFLSSSSATYNCHSYAWNMSDGGQICWINNNLSSDPTLNSNLKKYWSDPIGYKETTETNAMKIHYYNSDHSAIKSSVSGMYESKWGSAPLMRHAPAYGPYLDMQNRHYYHYVETPTVYYGTVWCDTGTDPTIVNCPGRYYIADSSYNVQRKWRVMNAKENDITNDSSLVRIEASGTSAIITFYHIGIYKVFCDVYQNNTLIAQYVSHEVLVGI